MKKKRQLRHSCNEDMGVLVMYIEFNMIYIET